MFLRKQKGFTIVEVVMVLAIGGLIFAVVFAAYPRVQSARRDSQRKNDLASLTGELEFYQTNNRGSYPETQGEIDTLVANLGSDFDDPSSNSTYVVTRTTLVPSAIGAISYYEARECNGTNSAFASSGFNRTYALLIRLEEGLYCIDR